MCLGSCWYCTGTSHVMTNSFPTYETCFLGKGPKSCPQHCLCPCVEPYAVTLQTLTPRSAAAPKPWFP